jgi:hypothetical protein
MLDLITQVRNLALDAELKGQKALAKKPRAVVDEVEAPISADRPNCGPGKRKQAQGVQSVMRMMLMGHLFVQLSECMGFDQQLVKATKRLTY